MEYYASCISGHDYFRLEGIKFLKTCRCTLIRRKSRKRISEQRSVERELYFVYNIVKNTELKGQDYFKTSIGYIYILGFSQVSKS